MPADPEDLRELLLKIRYDCTAIQAKVTDAMDLLARLNVPKPPPAHACPVSHCGVDRPTAELLVEHLENVHGIREKVVSRGPAGFEESFVTHEPRTVGAQPEPVRNLHGETE